MCKLTISWTALLQGPHRSAYIVGVIAAVIIALAVYWLLLHPSGPVPIEWQTAVASLRTKKTGFNVTSGLVNVMNSLCLQ